MKIIKGYKKISYLLGIISSSYIRHFLFRETTREDFLPAGIVIVENRRLVSPIFRSITEHIKSFWISY